MNLPWWLVEWGIWFVVWMAVPVGALWFIISRLALKRYGWIVTRRVWYGMCAWYICAVVLVILGGQTWLGWMLSILYLITTAAFVLLATKGKRKPGPHPPQPMVSPIVGVDDFQNLLNKRRQAYAKMVQP